MQRRSTTPPGAARRILCTLVVAAAAACAPSDPRDVAGEAAAPGPVEGEGQPALLVGVEGDQPEIRVPATVAPGEELRVRVTTWGLDGCWRKGETAVSVEGMTAAVRPFDHGPTGDSICTQAIQEFTHEATLTFNHSGTARVVVEGRRLEDRAAVSFVREVKVGGDPASLRGGRRERVGASHLPPVSGSSRRGPGQRSPSL